MDHVRIHRYSAGPQGALVNAYLVETAEGIVAVDGTLTVTDGRALRSQLDSLGKPLLAALVTHSHPDHYGGIVELVRGDDVPVIAAVGVDTVIRRDDAVKEQILRPMFGDEWPLERVSHPHRPGRRDDRPRRRRLHRPRPRAGRIAPRQHLAARRRPAHGVRRRSGLRPHARLPRRRLLRGVARQHRTAAAGAACGRDPAHRPRRPGQPAQLDWQREYIETFLDAVRDGRLVTAGGRKASRSSSG